ncbi:MAG: hypothetical protein KZQ98_12595 [Candidatus Thiodiazotropha sp. (ex Lucinoma borealis)]|nr:hypothetical protein [Candidatus Thiodiazotropha sp. (ex Lucinoma borealis)]
MQGVIVGGVIWCAKSSGCRTAVKAGARAAAKAIADACTDDPECDPPEGTICSQFDSGGVPHKTKDFDGKSVGKQRNHVHIWQMNKAPTGCYWNKMTKVTLNYTPVNARACSSYPSWVAQQGG